MAGPTPVSALIHAATMVTAGVYLVARTNVLFALAPLSSTVVAGIGALTALFAATIGLRQYDIKKVLAYSTVSQLGFMFVAVGTGAYTAGMFHLVAHAFFKALLFLGAGSVIYAMHHAYHATHSHADAQDMRNMGGLKQYMPVTFWLMLIATLAIAGIPPFAGFFSKDEILAAAYARGESIPIYYVFYAMSVVAALLTVVLHGPPDGHDLPGGESDRGAGTGPPARRPAGHDRPAGGARRLQCPRRAAQPAAVPGWRRSDGALARARHGPGRSHLRSRDAPRQHRVLPDRCRGGHRSRRTGARVVAHDAPPHRCRPPSRPRIRGSPGCSIASTTWTSCTMPLIVRPLVWLSRVVLWHGVDQGVVDGAAVNGTAKLSRGLGWLGSRLQTGQVGVYVVLFLVGALWVLHTVVQVTLPMSELLASISFDRWILHAWSCCRSRGWCRFCWATSAAPSEWRWSVTLLEFLLSVGLWWAVDRSEGGMQLVSSAPWIPRWGISYRVGIDGISLFMVLLTTAMMPLSVLASWSSIDRKERAFYALMLTLLTGLIGVFIALDLFVFYVFFEVMLIPMYFIIGIWGGANRLYAAIKFFIYTMAGSLLMLVAIVVMAWKIAGDHRHAVVCLRAPAAERRHAGPGGALAVRRLCAGVCHQGARSSRCTPGCPTPTSRRPPPAACCWPP